MPSHNYCQGWAIRRGGADGGAPLAKPVLEERGVEMRGGGGAADADQDAEGSYNVGGQCSDLRLILLVADEETSGRV